MVKVEKRGILDGDNNVKNTLPSHLCALISSHTTRFMNKFIKEINGFYKNSLYSGDTKAMYIERK